MLADRFGRIHDYLRIAITDKCNFRCTYCMPCGKIKFLQSSSLMSAREIISIASAFASLGVKKIRLTGGEPLNRADFPEIIGGLSSLPVELTFTSNGFFIDKHIRQMKAAGIKSVNISLDSLDKDNFFRITGINGFERVWKNIESLLAENFHVRVNTVLMQGKNDHEIPQLVGLTRELPLHVRFIEFMPFSGNNWQNKEVFTGDLILEKISNLFPFIKLPDEKHDTAKKYAVPGYAGTFAIISTMSEPFCGNCNRVRLTADGKIKNCLFSSAETDLLSALRNGHDLEPLIRKSLMLKEKERGGQIAKDFRDTNVASLLNRSMVNIGG